MLGVKRKASEDAIRCICGDEYDDGFSIACDKCSRWCHAACFGIVDGAVPEVWKCWLCSPEKQMKLRNNTRIRRSSAISEPQSAKRRRRPSVPAEPPVTQSYVPISTDIVHPDACASLRRHAAHWRGVSALTPVVLDPDHCPPPTALRQLPSPAMPFTNPDVLPPTYALHTTAAIPADSYIAPFTSTITPSSSYLADPLNAYTHLGMPKPFVHLIGPPLDLALDARLSGDKSRFVRSGCRPNAVLRPTLCQQSSSLSFGVFALRDLKPNEEVILGWEWDDGNVVHSLPALIETPQMFPHPPSSSNSPHQIQRIRNQMANILHALSSTFTTCACGEKAKDCALNQMAAFVEANQLDNVDLGPLVGNKRGFRTREKLPFSSGMGGVEMDIDEPIPSLLKGKGKAIGAVQDDIIAFSALLPPSSIAPPRMQRSSSHTSTSSKDNTTPLPEPDPPDQPLTEDHMPPKFRKKWKQQHRKLHSPGASILNVGIRIEEPVASSSKIPIDFREMPPPPLPSSSSNDLSHLPLTSFDGTSPSTSFSRLSLASANVDDNTPSPYQPWAPFARKEDAPPAKADRDDDNKMDIDADSHNEPPITTVEETPHVIPSPSPRSPPITLSSRSRSPSQSARSRSPSSTAITTPPSPSEPKLPDVVPPPPTASSSPPRHESEPEIVVLVPKVEDEPIRDSPESPPQIVVDLTSRSPSPIRPVPSPAPVPPPPPALGGYGKEDGEIEDNMDMQVDVASPKTPPRSPVSDTGITLPSTAKTPDSPAPTTSSTAAVDTAIGDKATGEMTTPSAPAAKVKLSLKDFAARRKKLREDGVDTSSGGKTPASVKKVEEVEVPRLEAGTGKDMVGVSGTGTAAVGDTEKKASSVTECTTDLWTGRAYSIPYSTLPSSSTKSDTSLSSLPSSSTWTSFASPSTSTTSTSKSLTSSLSTTNEIPSATIKTVPPPKLSAISTLPLKLHSEMLTTTTTTSTSTKSKAKAKPSNPWSSTLPILSSSSTSTLPSTSSTSTTSKPSMSTASKTTNPLWPQTESSSPLPLAEDQKPWTFFGWGQVPAQYRSLFAKNEEGEAKAKSEWERLEKEEKEKKGYEWNITSKSGTNAVKNVGALSATAVVVDDEAKKEEQHRLEKERVQEQLQKDRLERQRAIQADVERQFQSGERIAKLRAEMVEKARVEKEERERVERERMQRVKEREREWQVLCGGGKDEDVQAKQEPVEPTATATTAKAPIVNGWRPSFSPSSRDEAESSSTTSSMTAATTTPAPAPVPIAQLRKPSALSMSSSAPSFPSVNIPTSPRIRLLQPSLPTGPRAMNAMTRGRPPPPSAPMAMRSLTMPRRLIVSAAVATSPPPPPPPSSATSPPPPPPPPPATSPPPQPPPPPTPTTTKIVPIQLTNKTAANAPSALPGFVAATSVTSTYSMIQTMNKIPLPQLRNTSNTNISKNNPLARLSSSSPTPPPPSSTTTTVATKLGLILTASSTTSTKSSTPTSSTPATPTLPLPPTPAVVTSTSTIPVPPTAGLPSRPPDGLGFDSISHDPHSSISSATRMSMVRTVGSKGKYNDRERDEDRYDSWRDSERSRERDRDRDRDRERGRSRDRSWERDSYRGSSRTGSSRAGGRW